VDFIKADDIMAPEYHAGEIEMLHLAIEKCGRPIVLSLSLGEPPLYRAAQLTKNSNMYRISDDFWDNWPQLLKHFDLINSWSNYAGPGHWPDADMLPIGHISLKNQPKGKDRMSKLSWPEHYTLMTLWSIARSPLMVGADLPTSSDSTLSFLTNDEVLYVNQNSTGGRQILKGYDGEFIWMADDPATGDYFLALFNTNDQEKEIAFIFETVDLRSPFAIRDLWKKSDLGIFRNQFKITLPAHGAGLFRMRREQ